MEIIIAWQQDGNDMELDDLDGNIMKLELKWLVLR